jgi:hypothetical protein
MSFKIERNPFFFFFELFKIEDLVTFEDPAKNEKWKKAMDLEIDAILRNQTWKLIDLPREAKKIGVKWVFKTKLNEKGEVEKI